MTSIRRFAAWLVVARFAACAAAFGQDVPRPPADESDASPDEEDEPDEAPPLAPLEVRVNDAVDRACAHLLSKQDENGGFGTYDEVHPIGRTSLTLLAVLHGGVSETEPRVARAIDFLVTQLDRAQQTRAPNEPVPRRSTYETGITLMLLYDLGPSPRFASRMEPLARFLIDNLDRGQRMWGYPDGSRDLSNSQYAILGLRAAARRDIRPPGFKETLHVALTGVMACQRPNGGIAYQPDKFAKGSMTVAGLAMIRFIAEELDGYGASMKDLQRAKKCVKAAQTWLDANFSVEDHREGLSRGMSNYYYYMYGLERYAAYFGLKEIAGHAWYKEGAEVLLRLQNDDGGFGSSIEETAFAVLFLRKASLTPPSGHGPAAYLDPASKPPKPPPKQPVEGVAFLRDWLLLGPFPQTADDDALEVDHIGEAKVRPAHGKGTKGSKWARYASPADEVDLIKGLTPNGGINFDRVAAYAAAWFTAEEACSARLWLDSDDGIRVFLNGAIVLDDHHHDGKGGMMAPLALVKGPNVVLLKLENVGYGCHFKARLTDDENRGIAGVTVGTKP